MLTVYAAQGCASCEAVVKDLDRRGVPYVVVDVERSPAGAEELSRLTGGRVAVPTVVDEHGEVMMGFGNT